jgi:hypothetical protein
MSTLDNYGNQIEMNQLPVIPVADEKQDQSKPYVAKVLLQSPLHLEKILELHTVEKQAGIFLKGVDPTKRFTLILTIVEDTAKPRLWQTTEKTETEEVEK